MNGVEFITIFAGIMTIVHFSNECMLNCFTSNDECSDSIKCGL